MSLIIGSAQFGLDYGISNNQGRVARHEVKKILELAEKNNINEIDTAINYGSSQSIIGSINSSIKVSSKLPLIDLKPETIEKNLVEITIDSLNTLKRSYLKTLYLHNPDQLFELHGNLLYENLQKLKLDGLIKAIGISVYDPTQLNNLIKNFDFDVVQIPYNLIDRRFATNSLLDRLVQKNIEINCRSIFLQGLLLMKFNDIPKKFSRWNFIFRRWHDWLHDNNIDPVHACILAAKENKKINNLVIGVQTANQLKHIINFYSMANCSSIKLPIIQSDDTDLVNPSMWGSL